MTPLKFHDITLVKGAVARNFKFELLSKDPDVLVPGHFWASEAGGVKYSYLDSNKAVQVGVIANQDDLTKAIALVQGQITTATQALNKAVSDEAARAQAQEGVLLTAINKEVADRIQALLDEAKARTDGDAAVQATAAAALATETQARLDGDKAQSDATEAVQAELDKTQAAAGLSVNGEYVAPEHSNFLGSTKTLAEADVALDAAINAADVRARGVEKGLQDQITKEVQDRVADIASVTKTIEDYVNGKLTANADQDAAETKARIDGDKAIQAELDRTQSNIGLAEDGAYKAPEHSNYLASATTVMGGVEALDTALKTVADALVLETQQRTNTDDGFRTDLQKEITDRKAADVAFQQELDATQAGAGLESTGAYKAVEGTSFIAAAESLVDADVKLDAALKAVADRTQAIEATALPALTKALNDEITTARAAEAANAKAIADEAVAARAAEAVNAKAVSDEATARAAGDSALQAQIDTLKASSGEGASALKVALNNGRKTWLAPAAADTHNAVHGFGHENFIAQILVKGTDGVFRNEVMPWEVKQGDEANSIVVYLAEPAVIRVNFISTAQLA